MKPITTHHLLVALRMARAAAIRPQGESQHALPLRNINDIAVALTDLPPQSTLTITFIFPTHKYPEGDIVTYRKVDDNGNWEITTTGA